MTPTFFAKPSDFRKWLEKNHEKTSELIVGFYKVSSGKPSISWSQAVDEAICFGWIDGVRKSIDDSSYLIRFTPRKAGSIWSLINIKKVTDLSEQGLMKPAGIAAFEKRQEHKSGIYSFEQDPASLQLDKSSEKKFKANKKAWAFFQAQPASYRKPAIWKIISAKQEATKVKRLEELITDSAAGLHIKSLRRT